MTSIGTREPVPRLWRDGPPASAGSHTAVRAIPEPSHQPAPPAPLEPVRSNRGRTVSEIAARLGIAPGSVKSRMHYGMRALKLAL
ncbi:hypothetical protein C5C94_16550, partial [Rathayibacter sp. AY1C3]